MNWPRILTSSKFHAAALATAVLSVGLWFGVTDAAAPRAQKQAIIEHYLYAVAGVWGVSAAATGLEDAAAKRDAPSPRQGGPVPGEPVPPAVPAAPAPPPPARYVPPRKP